MKTSDLKIHIPPYRVDEPDTRVRRPVWLRHEGEYIVVLIERDGQWHEIIRERADGAFSHIWEDNNDR